MSAGTLISVEDFLRLNSQPNAEYRDGVVYPKPMPTWFHGAIEAAICAMLQKQGYAAAPEVTVRLSEQKWLVPDVIADSKIQHPYPTEPVLLCCEVLSPEDRLGVMLSKCEEYHAWGVPFCWVVDPEKRTAWEYHRGGEPVRVGSQLRAGDIALAVAEIFSVLG